MISFRFARAFAVSALSVALLVACRAEVAKRSANAPKKAAAPATVGTYGPWKSAPIRGGGFLQQVFFAPSDAKRMYLTSDVGGFWRSDDGGKRWRMLHGALPADAGSYSPRGFLVHPQNADRLLVATGSLWGQINGVFVSNDGGKTWKQTLKARFDGNGWYRGGGNVLAMSRQNPNLIIAAPLGGGLARSLDGGKTWTRSGPDDLSPTGVIFDAGNPRRVWVCAKWWGEVKHKRADNTEVGLRGGLLVSNDAGATWTQLGEDAPEELFQDPGDLQTLYGLRFDTMRVARSRDGGKTWQEFSQGLAPDAKGDARNDGTYAGIASGPNFLLLGSHGGHFYRLDKGATTWRKVEPKTINEGDWWGRLRPDSVRHFGSALSFVGINPRNPKHWAFTDWYALYQSFDAGQSWNLTLDGIEMTVINTVAQEPTNARTMHAGMADVGYFQAAEGGRAMRQITSGVSNNVKCLATTPAQPGRVYATGTSDWEWKANALFVSDDAGRTWTRSPMRGLPDMKERRCETVSASPTRKDEVWLSVSGAVKPNEGGPYRSTDGGQSWKWEGEGLQDSGHGFFRSGFWVSGPELAMSGDGSLVASSDDHRLLARRGPNDNAWTMVALPGGAPNCLTADALTPGRFYLATGSGGLWRSDDGGASWRNVVSREVNWVAPDLTKPNRVVINTPTNVCVSLDAGETWRAMSSALPYRHPRNVVCFAGENVFVGTGGNGVFYASLASLQGAPKSMARAPKTEAVALLQNGDMTGGTTAPDAWSLADYREGRIALSRDAKQFASAPASLLLTTEGKAVGVAQQALQPTPRGEVTVSGKWKLTGEFDSVQAALQLFDADWKQLDWKVVALAPKPSNDWQTFESTQTVPESTAHALLNLSVSGNGRVWLDDVRATSKPKATQNTNNQVAALPVSVAANAPQLRYSGRFDWSDNRGPRCAWPASAVAIRFRGTALNARLSGGNNTRWQIEVDGKPTRKLALRGGEHLYAVAENLPQGEHTVRLVKATEPIFGTTQIHGFALSQGGKLLQAPKPKFALEVIGDSISAGYGNEAASRTERFSPDTENAYLTYGAIAARELNADYSCIAWSGKLMWPDNTLPEIYDYILPTEKQGVWNFKPQPDVVLINLATNDFAGGVPDEEKWTNAYTAFVQRVRRNYPRAHIFCAIGTMMNDWGPDNKPLSTLRRYLARVVENSKASGDARVSVLDFGTQDAANGFGADWHPNVKTNEIMAAQLVAEARRLKLMGAR